MCHTNKQWLYVIKFYFYNNYLILTFYIITGTHKKNDLKNIVGKCGNRTNKGFMFNIHVKKLFHLIKKLKLLIYNY